MNPGSEVWRLVGSIKYWPFTPGKGGDVDGAKLFVEGLKKARTEPLNPMELLMAALENAIILPVGPGEIGLDPKPWPVGHATIPSARWL